MVLVCDSFRPDLKTCADYVRKPLMMKTALYFSIRFLALAVVLSSPVQAAIAAHGTSQALVQSVVTPFTQSSVSTSKGDSVGYDVSPPASWVKPLDPDGGVSC
jgi:hypothetical protein